MAAAVAAKLVDAQ